MKPKAKIQKLGSTITRNKYHWDLASVVFDSEEARGIKNAKHKKNEASMEK